MIEMSERGKRRLENPEPEEELKRLFLGIMEGYNDAVIPPLSYFSPSRKTPSSQDNSPSSRKKHKTDSESSHKERRRREKMSESFSLLQSMVPSYDKFPKQPRQERILADTVNYIKHLQEEAERLEGLVRFQRKVQKVGMPVRSKCTNHSSVNFTVSNSATFIAIQLPSRHGSVLGILKVLEKHQAEVIEARIDVNDEKVLTFTATVRLGNHGGSTIEMIRQEILTSLYLVY